MFTLLRNDRTAPVTLYNTATRAKEAFAPVKRRTVLMYSCGPTVYDYIHIGNLRAYLVPDLLRRLFLSQGYTVKHTINVTDFGHLTDDGDNGEDKIMKGMRREGYEITLTNMLAFVLPYIASFKEDLASFGNLPPTELARASDYVRAQIKIIETLQQKGYAYETTDGVYFDITKFPAYGVLGNIDVAALQAGARVATNDEKHHPADFALWKKGTLGWESRWGTGFPGWHIECTAMVFATLGKEIDIHTGGEDLMYTHHNGEIAQAEAVTGKRYVRYWLHNAFVTMNNDKMAKSKGTGVRLQDLVNRGYSALDYRYWLLQSHYRSPANFTFEALESAHQALTRLRRYVYVELKDVRASYPDQRYEAAFAAALGDDLDTPRALSLLWELQKDTNIAPEVKLATIHHADSLLSLGLAKTVAEGLAELGHIETAHVPPEIQILLAKRNAARAEKNWLRADQLRDEIAAAGFMIEDTDQGARLTRR
jgi:cysteinyl-tRNA synthetase